jgi:hypothetical protein
MEARRRVGGKGLRGKKGRKWDTMSLGQTWQEARESRDDEQVLIGLLDVGEVEIEVGLLLELERLLDARLGSGREELGVDRASFVYRKA